MTCNAGCHVTYCSTYTTREPNTAPDCTGSNAKEHARWDLTSETAHLCSTSIFKTLRWPMSCQQYSAPMRNCAMLSSRKSNPHIEIENRHAMDASLSLSEISDAQPGRVDCPPPTHPHTYIHTPSSLLNVHPGVPTSCRLKYPNPHPGCPSRSTCEMRPMPRRSGRGL